MKGDQTKYEWVVEEMEDDEIVDCFYFDTQTEALVVRNALLAEGKAVDFGVCKRFFENQGDAEDIILDEASRTYAYVDEDGKLPALFEDGSAVPKRFF